MRNAGLEEAQAGIKIAWRNINNLRYADDTTLMAESEEELKRLLMKVKVESEKVGLKLNIQKTKIMASGPITSWEIDGETVETVADFIFLGSAFFIVPNSLPYMTTGKTIALTRQAFVGKIEVNVNNSKAGLVGIDFKCNHTSFYLQESSVTTLKHLTYFP